MSFQVSFPAGKLRGPLTLLPAPCYIQSIFRLPALVSFPLSPFGGRSRLGSFHAPLGPSLFRSFRPGPPSSSSTRPRRWYFSRSASISLRCLVCSLFFSACCLLCSRCISSANMDLSCDSLGAFAGAFAGAFGGTFAGAFAGASSCASAGLSVPCSGAPVVIERHRTKKLTGRYLFII
jgi:hypothetical protein